MGPLGYEPNALTAAPIRFYVTQFCYTLYHTQKQKTKTTLPDLTRVYCHADLFWNKFEMEWNERVSKVSTTDYFCQVASIAQLGERQTEDLKVVGSIPTRGMIFSGRFFFFGV